MFENWTSFEEEVRSDAGHQSVLSQFPIAVGLEVASSVVRNLAQSVGKSSETGERSSLQTDSHVEWTMQVLCHGLTLPFSEFETIRDCVNVYCDWLTCLTEPSRPSIPQPIADDVNAYTRTMLHHLYNVFVPRQDSTADHVKRQTLLCHRVLRAVQSNVEKSSVVTSETWDHILKFLLKISDALLSPPLEKDSIGSNLCERVLSVLFELWIVACVNFYPTPPLWKTLREVCAGWRHHETLVAQWHRVVSAFTSRLLRVVYGNNFRTTIQISEEEERLIPEVMDNERVVQCWFRFLHILGNPVDLCRSLVISSTQKFLHAALTSDQVVDPHQHDCLKYLPLIFYRAMRSLSSLVDCFLCLHARDYFADSDWLAAVAALRPPTQQLSTLPSTQPAVNTTPPATRKNRGSILLPHPKGNKDALQRSVAIDNAVAGTGTSSFGSVQSSLGSLSVERSSLSPCRPTVNSLLHLLGSWLLEASLIGVRVYGSDNKGGSAGEDSEGNEAGRAQACGALCRIFCSHRTGEEILPVYTSRFYISMYYALHMETDCCGIPLVLSSVITNGSDLLRVDLDGAQVLLPRLLHAIQSMAPHFRYKQDGVDEDVELRRASIQILLSMLCLPLHFGKLQICSILEDQHTTPKTTFLSLRGPITELLIKLLTNETDSTNTQMLLGGLVVCIIDLAIYEQNSSSSEPTISPNASQELFGQATSLICSRLMTTWKAELGTALATLEVLSALTRVRLSNPNVNMCKRAVNWICEFVVYQCLRPAPAHSKDLHSMIVAAFQCLTTWLLVHDYLMHDSECMQTVLQVVELGISGFRSQVGDPTHNKGEKELKPVSMRVREAAEALVTVIIDYVGCYPPPCAPESLCTLLDEETLMRRCKSRHSPGDTGAADESPPLVDSELPFQYYVLDGSTIVALLEKPVLSDDDSLPTVTALVRGSFGRHAWTLQLRHQPRANTQVAAGSSSQKTTSLAQQAVNHTAMSGLAPPSRPAPIQHQYFPDVVDQIPRVLADLSIPKLENTMNEYKEELSKLKNILNKQIEFEEQCRQRHLTSSKPLPRCSEPKLSSDIQTARLFLSHYGFLTLEGLKAGVLSSMPPSLIRLDCSRDRRRDLMMDLKHLDSLPVRTADTVQIFYMRSGQYKLTDILQNVTRQEFVQEQFLEFIRSLGWPVDIDKHAGWTGSVATSWKINHATQSPADSDEVTQTGGSLYDGRKQIIYWSDVSCEVVFMVPSPITFNSNLTNQTLDSSTSSATTGSDLVLSSTGQKQRVVSLDLDASEADMSSVQGGGGSTLTSAGSSATAGSRLRRSGRSGVCMVGTDVQVVIVWIEKYEDHANFPVADLVKSSLVGTSGTSGAMTTNQKQTPPHFCIIYVHPLRTGLYRIHLQSQQTRESEAVPLVEGMVLSHRLLGHVVRQTAVNIFRRRQLDSEQYQPPHVRRKLKIKEITEKYKSDITEPEFYESLFRRDSD